VARPLLTAALEGGDGALDTWVARFAEELTAAMFLSASATVPALRSAATVIGGETRRWLDELSPT
jgi:isopentenyl diphosphate isomerase/L-lactate dehydrogenase-like FMN-dependent dehydrogenase